MRMVARSRPVPDVRLVHAGEVDEMRRLCKAKKHRTISPCAQRVREGPCGNKVRQVAVAENTEFPALKLDHARDRRLRQMSRA